MAQTSSVKKCGRATVKLVTSGDQIVVRGQPRGGPPKEKTILFSNLDAGKPARKANPAMAEQTTKNDDTYAWAAREKLRKKLIGKEVYFEVEDSSAGTGAERSYGVVWLGSSAEGENLTHWSLQTGNAQIREAMKRRFENGEDEEQKKLVEMEKEAETNKLGRWAPPDEIVHRNIKWVIDEPTQFVESNRASAIPAVVEHVFSASMVRLYLVDSESYITMSLTGIRGPAQAVRDDKGNPTAQSEPFFAEAKYFVECRLLGKDVNVRLEGTAPERPGSRGKNENQLFVGTVEHSKGNISELLLKEGFAKCVDWSMGQLSSDPTKYRNAERSAKMARKRIWKNWTPADAAIPESEREFTGKVVQVINSDSLAINDGTTIKTIFLASLRPVRINDLPEGLKEKAQKQGRDIDKSEGRRKETPLYTVPYLYEAREFLRKKLVGKKVHVKVDYIRKEHYDEALKKTFEERLCGTVTYQGTNISEALVSRGIAMRIKHRNDDDNRSSAYDELISADQRAEKGQKGVYATTLPEPMRVADVSSEIPKAKAFLPFLMRAGKCEAVVDFVFSGSRLKLYIPKETCLITFLIGGIECPRTARPAMGTKAAIPADPFADEAMELTRDLCLQKDVHVEVDTMDKVGGFVGYIFSDKVNISVKLVESGFAKVHYTGEKGKYSEQLMGAQEKAQQAGLCIWKDWVPPKEEDFEITNGNVPVEQTERNVNYVKIMITEVTPNMTFYGQHVATSDRFQQLTDSMRKAFADSPPTPGVYQPRRNNICAAIFPEDGLWYRGKIEKVSKNTGSALVTFIDFGNRADVDTTKLAELPTAYSTSALPAQAHEYVLALIRPPTDIDSQALALERFISLIGEEYYYASVEMKEGQTSHVTLKNEASDDIGSKLLANGFCTTVKKAPRYLSELHSEYLKQQNVAAKQHLNLWRYGDITEDDDNEFGMNNAKTATT